MRHLGVILSASLAFGHAPFASPCAQLDVLAPGFEVDLVTTLVDSPISLALAPSGSPYGEGNLFVGVSDGCGVCNDGIYRVTPGGGVTTFAQLECGATPIALEFPPLASPFGTSLYVSANNSDNFPCGGGDCGGTIQLVSSAGVWVDFTERTGGPIFPGCSMVAELTEPTTLAFGRGGAFGTDLYVANSNDDSTFNPPGPVMRLAPSSAVSTEIFSQPGLSANGMRFGRGGGFGGDLYLGNPFANVIVRYDGAMITPFVQLMIAPQQLGTLEFGQGLFGSKLYVAATTGIYTIAPNGTIEHFATGLNGLAYDNLEFAAGGQALYVADPGGEIYRVRPKHVRRR